MSKLRAPVWTQLVPVEVRDALAAAWPNAPPDAIAVLMSQIAVETGWGKCVCWNLGNVKGDARFDYPVTSFRTTEYVHGVKTEMMCTFRAFDSLADGCAFYLDFLNRKYAAAWSQVLAGDVRAFARALKAHAYYTAPLEDYTRGLEAQFDLWRTPSLATPEEAEAALGGTNVQDFQRAHGLAPDGVVGAATRHAIRAWLATVA